MHTLFADWYMKADPHPDPQLLERRWQCVVAVASGFFDDLEFIDILDVGRGTPGTNRISEQQRTQLITSCKEVDPTYPATNNDMLLALTVGAAAAHALSYEGKAPTATSLALYIRSSSYMGLEPPFVIDELGHIANKYLLEEGTRMRKLVDVDELLAQQIPKIGKVTAETVVSVVTNLQAAFINLVGELRDQLAPSLDSMREETDMLWWVVGKRSLQLDADLDSLPPAAAALIVGLELESRTRFFSAPPALDAIIARSLPDAEPMSADELHAGISSYFSGGLPEFVPRTSVGRGTPVLDMLRRPVGGHTASGPRLTLAQWCRQLYDEALTHSNFEHEQS